MAQQSQIHAVELFGVGRAAEGVTYRVIVWVDHGALKWVERCDKIEQG